MQCPCVIRFWRSLGPDVVPLRALCVDAVLNLANSLWQSGQLTQADPLLAMASRDLVEEEGFNYLQAVENMARDLADSGESSGHIVRRRVCLHTKIG
jgi:hypothetical protein